jgi:hypothetical protein
MKRAIRLTVSSLLLVLAVTACKSRGRVCEEVITSDPTRRTIEDLLPPEESESADFSTAKIYGSVSDHDLRALSSLIGRIRAPRSGVLAVWVAWDSYAVAAKVQLSSFFVYCTKDIKGDWHIVKIQEYSI